MKSVRYLVVTWVVVAMTLLSLSQSNVIPLDTVLVYEREQGDQLVSLSQTQQLLFMVPENTCRTVAPDKPYMTVVPETDTSGNLQIYNLLTQQIIFEVQWRPEWEPCYAPIGSAPVPSGIIVRLYNTATQSSEYYEFDSGALSLLPNPFASSTQPALPDWLPITLTNFILPSPEEHVYLYDRCNGQQTIELPSNRLACSSQTELVVYNTQTQSTLHVLSEPDDDLIRGYEYRDPLRRERTFPGAAWSYDGRYISYPRRANGAFDFFNLTVLDVINGLYLDTSWVNAQIDWDKATQWSPASDKLAFWVKGRFDEPQVGDTVNLRTLVFFDAISQEFMILDTPVNLEDRLVEIAGQWSPDGQSYAFVTLEGELFHVDVLSGNMTLLDTNVSDIITWGMINTSDNLTPSANAGPDQTVTDTDNSGSESVILDGSASTDSDGTITSYSWSEGGVEIATGATPAVDLAVGTHVITLTVTDNDDLTATDDVTITVQPGSGTSSAVTSFTLVNAVTDTDVTIVNNGDTVYLNDPVLNGARRCEAYIHDRENARHFHSE